MSANVKMGKDHIAFEKKKQSALTKAVKLVKVKGKAPKAKSKETSEKGIIMLKHIPHGFYEKEMRSYFSQFGKVLRIRLARSTKTGNSRGYGFVEFEIAEVAKIAAESMNNYLMFERLIKCELVSPDANTKQIFKFKNIRENNYPKMKTRAFSVRKESRILTEDEQVEIMKQRMAKLEEQNNKFAEMGIDYQYPISESTLIKSEEVQNERFPKPVFATPVKGKKSLQKVTPGKEKKTPEKTNSLTLLKNRKSQSPQNSEIKKTPVRKESEDVRDDLSTPVFATTKRKSTPVKERHSMQKGTPGKGKKTPEKNILSPKLSNAKKSQSPNRARDNETKKSPMRKEKTEDTQDEQLSSPVFVTTKQKPTPVKESKSIKKIAPGKLKKTPEKFSPKLLRNRKSQGAPAKFNAKNTPERKEKTEDIQAEQPATIVTKPTPVKEITSVQKITLKTEKKTPEKNKFSPKLLRSRKSLGPKTLEKNEETKKTPGKKEKLNLPRISPKLLRSRKSDASSLTPLAGKSTPAKQKKGGRKSVF